MHRTSKSLSKIAMACKHHRCRSMRVELGIQEEEWQASEVITVEVTDHDGINRSRVDAGPLETDQAGRAAIEEAAPAAVFDQDASLEAAAAAEGIAAADEPNSCH